MLIVLLAVLVAPVLSRLPFLCTQIRFETESEAERRQIYEHCTETCNDSPSSTTPCADCKIPYEGYGCLRRRREAEMNCIMDCDMLLPDRVAQLRCVESCSRPGFSKLLL